MMIWDRQTSCNGSYRGQNIVHLPIETGPGQTDPLMEGHKFRSGLTEVTGDGTYICITMSQICFETLTNNSPSRAASSQLKITLDTFERNFSPVKQSTSKWKTYFEVQEKNISPV